MVNTYKPDIKTKEDNLIKANNDVLNKDLLAKADKKNQPDKDASPSTKLINPKLHQAKSSDGNVGFNHIR